MKGKDVKIGEVYLAKVSGKLVRVKILERRERVAYGIYGRSDAIRPYWIGRNEATGREVTIRGAGRLRQISYAAESVAAHREV